MRYVGVATRGVLRYVTMCNKVVGDASPYFDIDLRGVLRYVPTYHKVINFPTRFVGVALRGVLRYVSTYNNVISVPVLYVGVDFWVISRYVATYDKVVNVPARCVDIALSGVFHANGGHREVVHADSILHAVLTYRHRVEIGVQKHVWNRQAGQMLRARCFGYTQSG